MYDRTDHALWAQLTAEAISGPHVGTQLKVLPVSVTTLAAFQEEHPGGFVVTIKDTGEQRPYGTNLGSQMQNSGVMWNDVPKMGKLLPPHTLGMGILAGERAIFVMKDAIKDGPLVVETAVGNVIVESDEAGMSAVEVPDGVVVAQSFYYGWSAFYPETEIIGNN